MREKGEYRKKHKLKVISARRWTESCRFFSEFGSQIRVFSRSPHFFRTGLIQKNPARSGPAPLPNPDPNPANFLHRIRDLIRFWDFLNFLVFFNKKGGFMTIGLLDVKKFSPAALKKDEFLIVLQKSERLTESI